MPAKVRNFIIILLALLPVFCLRAECLSISAKAYVLYDVTSDEVLCGKNIQTALPIASTTKLMTALTAINLCEGDFDREIKIKAEYTHTEGSSIYLKEGETLTVRDLLYGIMLESGNDAGLAIAGGLAGSTGCFVDMMNQTAQSIGLVNSSFKNPHGLDEEGHYSCALDLARIMAEAMKMPEFAQICGCKHYTAGTRSMTNHNRLLWTCTDVDGGKTGYTKSAGRCLVSTAMIDGRRFVAVTLNAPDDWNDHIKLYDYARSMLKEYKAVDSATFYQIPVISGTVLNVTACAANDLSLYLRDEETEDIRLVPEAPHFVYAPIKIGDIAGTLKVYSGNHLYGEVKLVYCSGADQIKVKEKKGFFGKLFNFIRNLFL